VIATSNIIRNAGEGIAVSVVEGAGETLIANNIIRGSKNGAIVGHEWSKAVTRDLALTKTSSYDHLTIKGNRVS
jgi:hypothetical protein